MKVIFFWQDSFQPPLLDLESCRLPVVDGQVLFDFLPVDSKPLDQVEGVDRVADDHLVGQVLTVQAPISLHSIVALQDINLLLTGVHKLIFLAMTLSSQETRTIQCLFFMGSIHSCPSF